jgi:hypothetical protein
MHEKNQLSSDKVDEFLAQNNRTLPRRTWIPDQTRTTGLFVHDLAIDLRTLFSVSVNRHEPELAMETIELLREKGWKNSKNVFGDCLELPEKEQANIIPKLAESILNWRITSNQSRTFSPMELLAIAISYNANKIATAIRAKVDFESDNPKAIPIVEPIEETELFVTPPCGAFIDTGLEKVNAIDDAVNSLTEKIKVSIL